MPAEAVHQFHPSCAPGDGVTNGMLFTRRLLRELGFASEIYCDHIPPALASEVRPRRELESQGADWLLVHHSLGYEDDAWLAAFARRAILVYHNITPVEMLPAQGPWRHLAALGRRQLTEWRPWFAAAIGVSALNAAELRQAGYADARVLPLLVDLSSLQAAPWDAQALRPYRDTTTILFVGRLAPNKRHDLLIDAFAEYLHHTDEPACLVLAGGEQDADWSKQLRSRVSDLGVAASVDFLGPVPDPTLRALYRAADLFACFSDHEGFGMPLIEAGLFDVPVLARATSGVADTLGEGGLLTDSDDPRILGALMHTLVTEHALRRRVIAGQQANLRRFDPRRLAGELAACLRDVGLHPSGPAAFPEPQAALWRVEGPFDSSYSLAVVNRELARALAAQGPIMSLAITPGAGEPLPDPLFLRAHPDVALMAARGQLPGAPLPAGMAPADGDVDGSGASPVATEVTLRFTYPPACDAMAGRVRAVHCYGWEETGFPDRYVSWFNRKLDLVTVLSRQVEKTLRDAGVRVPIAVVGAGVDQLPVSGTPVPPRIAGKAYRFLHVSSCFARKGADVLLAAYGQAFRSTDDVSLVIKTFPNPHNDVADQLAARRRQDPGYPDVVLISEDWPQADIAALYRHCHAFVAPARGEGLGLPMAEAMRFGLPVITTGWGGQTDFCSPETAWLIDYRFAPARTHLAVDHSAWAEPDDGHLARLMAEVYRATPAALAPRLAAARALVDREYTWARTAEKTRAALAALDAAPMLAAAPRIGWVSSWNTRCGIASYSAQLSAAIPADRLHVYASDDGDRVAPDGANVSRIWSSGLTGHLDRLRERLAGDPLEALVIQYNFGFFPLAQLAALIEDNRRLGRQVHVFLHATKPVDKPGFKASLLEIAPSLARADRLFVHGFDDLERLREFGLAANTTLFAHGIPQPAPSADDAMRAAQGLTGTRVIASYGFLLPHKGQRQLVEAFALLAPRHPDLRLVLTCALYPAAESLAERDAIEALVDERGLRGRVRLITDFLSDSDSLSWLRLADLVVYPYQHTQESSSAAVRMGLASGVPVAVTPLPIFDDVGDAAHRLPGTSPAEIAAGISALLTDPARLAAGQEAAGRFVRARAWPVLARRLVNLIDGLANPL